MIKDIDEKNATVKINDKELEILKEYFPACFSKEGSFDIERFKNYLSDKIEINHEGYELNFLGKSYAKLIASLDTTTVIEPDLDHNQKLENINSENVFISGDNLDALKHLLKSYSKQVKCIYIDPPYNTGSDSFIYKDNFNFSVNELQEKLSLDEHQAQRILDLTNRNSSSHSAWLLFMYPRLALARDLLADDGVIFISIDDNEQANLKLLCDDIFGEENFIACIPWRKRTAKSDVPFGISQDTEWILAIARKNYFAGMKFERKYYSTPDYPNDRWRLSDLTTQKTEEQRPNSAFNLIDPKTNKEYKYNPKRLWGITKDTFEDYYKRGKIVFPDDYDFLNISIPAYRVFESEDIEKALKKYGRKDTIKSVSTVLPKEVGMNEDGNKEIDVLFGKKVFSFPKPTELIKYLLDFTVKEGDIVVDFFSGSATTAHSILKFNAENQGYNIKYILVQLPEILEATNSDQRLAYEFLESVNRPTTIDQIGMERIIRAAREIKEKTQADIDYGFKHYKLIESKPDMLDKLEEFNPNGTFIEESILDEYSIPTILTTWLVKDGYGFSAQVETINIDGYNVYHCDKHLYLVEPNISENVVKKLFEKYDTDGEFNPENIVIFGYSFIEWSINEMIENCLKLLNSSDKNLKVNIDTRY